MRTEIAILCTPFNATWCKIILFHYADQGGHRKIMLPSNLNTTDVSYSKFAFLQYVCDHQKIGAWYVEDDVYCHVFNVIDLENANMPSNKVVGTHSYLKKDSLGKLDFRKGGHVIPTKRKVVPCFGRGCISFHLHSACTWSEIQKNLCSS